MSKTVGKIVVPLLLLVTGFAAGFMTNVLKQGKKEDRASYILRREGATKHINPLLECDIADDVLRNKELVLFKSSIENYIRSSRAKTGGVDVSVYFRELNDGIWFSIGDSEKFVPASLRKLPLMIALLKMAEQRQKGFLESQVTFNLSRDYNLDQNIKPSQPMEPGHMYSIRDLIYRMIVYSDNNAFTLLTKTVDASEFDLAYSMLRMQNPRAKSDDEFLSVQTYASFFRILYNATYLSKEHSEWALDTLGKSEFRAGLVAGLPAGVPVSHKFGEKSDANGRVQLHDCGIVYFPNNPYLLCVMSKGPNFEVLDDVIMGVSRAVYHEVAAQMKPAK